MLVEGIKSRPVYKGLSIQPQARRHIFALEGEGPNALLDQQSALDDTVLSRSRSSMSLAARRARVMTRPCAGSAPTCSSRRQPSRRYFSA